VVDGAPPPEDDGGPVPCFHPIEYLAYHGIVARRRSLHAPVHETGDALLHEAQRMDSDLLVMGAYGHSRLRERVLGSATRRILQQATLPVLMQH
jgi:nucleotide-binding universal stress UspA family protein